ncbi:ankyrin repeat and SOCS box protein 5-like [Amphiura filiformis]|uniref:ankyrin repeat and SOCS box protein 5-like n=1 Tax=Amphiura filiformis TaxID=82378 RepID=UPI003B21803D
MAQKVSQLLNECSTQDTGDRTHLHYAASRGQLLTLYSLIKEGQNVNAHTCNGITALHDACWTGHVYSARHLIQAGAKVNTLDIAGQSPLIYASTHGHSDCVKLLLDSGANPDLENQRIPPLHAAAFEGAIDCVKNLMSSGADIEAKDRQQDTPLLTASKRGKVHVATALLQAGANVNVSTQETCDTPLHIASRRHDQDLSRLLIEYGANLSAINKDNKKPSQVVKPEGQGGMEMASLFKYYEDNPMTLASICRFGLRQYLGPNKLNTIPDLPLPDLMKRYLRCDDIKSNQETTAEEDMHHSK